MVGAVNLWKKQIIKYFKFVKNRMFYGRDVMDTANASHLNNPNKVLLPI